VELRTITEALDRAADRKDAGFTFVRDDASERTFTYADLALATRRIAAALQQLGVRKGERVALVLPTADEFVPAFLGVVRSGAIPVPLYPPLGMGQLGGYLDHAKHIVGAARASVVLTNTQIKAVLGKLHDTVPELRLMLTMAELEGDASLFREPGVTELLVRDHHQARARLRDGGEHAGDRVRQRHLQRRRRRRGALERGTGDATRGERGGRDGRDRRLRQGVPRARDPHRRC